MSIRASRDAFVGLAAWIAPLLLTMICTPVLVRGLGAEQYGRYALVVAFTVYSLQLSIGRALVRYAPQVDAVPARAAARLVARFTSLTVATGALNAAVLLPIVAIALDRPSPLALALLAATIVATSLMQVFGAVLQLLDRMPLYGAISATTNGVSIAGCAAVAALTHNWVAVLAWQTVSSASGAVALLIASRRPLRDCEPAPGEAAGVVPRTAEVFHYALVAGLPNILGSIIVLTERAVVAGSFGPSDVGAYSLAFVLAQLLHAIVFNGTITFPIAASRLDAVELAPVYESMMRVVLVGVATAATGLLVCGPDFLMLWAGPELGPGAAAALRILVIPLAVLAILVLPWLIAEARGFPQANVWLIASMAVVTIAALPLLLRLGVDGVALARAAGSIGGPVYVAYVERRTFGFVRVRFWIDATWRTAVVASCAGGVMFVIVDASWTRLLVAGASGVAVATLTALILGCIPFQLQKRALPA